MTKPPSAQVRRSALWTGAVMCALLLSTGSTRADDDNGIKELVKSMSDYLAAQKSISFDMQSTLDVVTTDGQRLGIASSGAVELNRPDKIRAERKGGFADVEVVFDGKTTFAEGPCLVTERRLRWPSQVRILCKLLFLLYNGSFRIFR